MSKTIMLVSGDEGLLNTRALILETAGYRTIKTGSLTSAIQLAVGCQMSIIGHTFTSDEHRDFVERVHETNPRIFILSLRNGLTQPQTLLDTVADCFAAQPCESRVCIVQYHHVIAWAKESGLVRLLIFRLLVAWTLALTVSRSKSPAFKVVMPGQTS
jgi:hypothetical protein